MATSRLLSGALLRLQFHMPFSLVRLKFQAYATYTTFGCTLRIESHSIHSSYAPSSPKKKVQLCFQTFAYRSGRTPSKANIILAMAASHSLV